MDNNGCYKCADRRPHCHSACERHKDWKAERDAKQAAIRAQKSKEHEATAVEVAAKLKAIKRRGD